MTDLKYYDAEEFKRTIADVEDFDDVETLDQKVGDAIVRKFGVVEIDEKDAEPTTTEGDGFELPFTISDGTVDRDGDTISAKGWKLKNYRKNPVVLWAHDGSSPPIARATKTFIDRDRKEPALRQIAEFPPADLYPFGNMIGRMFKRRFMNATSVGFRSLKMERSQDEDRSNFYMPIDFIQQELLENSAVPIPANPQALVEARSVGIDTGPMVEWAEKILDGEGTFLLVPRTIVEDAWKCAGGKLVAIKGKTIEFKADASAEEEDPADVATTKDTEDASGVDVDDTVAVSVAETVDNRSEDRHTGVTRDEARALIKSAAAAFADEMI